MRRALVLVCFACALASCHRQRVATEPDLPPLAPPPPPARVVTPPDTSQEPPTPAPEPEQRPPRRLTPRNQTARESAPKTEPPKPAAPPVSTPPPANQPQPATTLQTTPPATQLEMDRQARGLLAQARYDLGRVNQSALNSDGRGQFDTARRFIEQADEALKEQNFVLALRLADKAATIAGVLVGR